MDNQAYFNGDFWQCSEDTNAGEAPDTNPEKWRLVRIPAEFRRTLAKLTYANLLELDGQTDKAGVIRSGGESMLEDLTREMANKEHGRHNGSVHALQGQTVKASVILDDAYGMMRWDPDDLEDSEKADGRRTLSNALQQVWEAWWWDSLMLTEQVALRDAYTDGAFNPQGSEVYFPTNGKYYLAIQPAIGIPPLSPANGANVLNSGFWAESAKCYSGNDVDNTAAYSWGATVRNPVDGLFYQRGASLNVFGTNADFANQIYVVHPTANDSGRVIYWPGSAPSGDYNQATRFEANVPWSFTVVDNTPAIIAEYFGSTVPVPLTPDLETHWTVNNPGSPGTLPGPSFSRSFVAPAPPDTGHWGLLTAFDPVLTIARSVRSVTKQHPALSHNPEPYAFHQTDGGVRVPCWTCGLAWVWSRRVTPILTGNDFDPETTYEATATNDLVFDS